MVRNIVAPNGLKEILVPSWSLVNGQDDLVWHKPSRQADGSYRVTIKASEHKHSYGKYRADAYLIDNAGNRQYLTETVIEVSETKPSGSISILNNNGAGSLMCLSVMSIALRVCVYGSCTYLVRKRLAR